VLELIKSNLDFIDYEEEIMNSNPWFNIISTGVEKISRAELIEEHQSEEVVEPERYLIRWQDQYIGIIAFTMFNPKDQLPWIGLLVIDRKFHGKGIGKQAYDLVENMMVEKGASLIRLGCMKENLPGLSFWEKNGYKSYRETVYNERPMYCLEKVI
jgi:RimJ/RimL family protein N-acetyltransferase